MTFWQLWDRFESGLFSTIGRALFFPRRRFRENDATVKSVSELPRANRILRIGRIHPDP